MCNDGGVKAPPPYAPDSAAVCARLWRNWWWHGSAETVLKLLNAVEKFFGHSPNVAVTEHSALGIVKLAANDKKFALISEKFG
uniref:Uncharacterized protein n=1 Tax=Romanomermis culicivorax TaxID=13658 RepID=A0A915IF47_ROMCU